MEGTMSPVPSPPAAAPSPPLDEDDFGVRPADKCGGAYMPSNLNSSTTSYIEVIQNNTKDMPTELLSNTEPNVSAHGCPPNPPPAAAYISHHDTLQTQTNPYQTITSIQQQLQQAWSTSGMAESYATMSMSIPNLNFMQQFQQPSMPIMSTGYGVPLQPSLQSPYGNLGYETFQPSQPEQHTSPPLPPPDISSIPLPPGPNPQPPPPLPQEAPPPEQSNMYTNPQPPPPPSNPFETEYDPLYPQHSNFSEPAGYESTNLQYNSHPSPNDIASQSRYHPYNNQSPRGRQLSGPGNANSTPTNNRYSNNNSSPTGSQIPPLIELSPMERFSQSLNKNRNPSANSTSIPESPVNSVGDWSALKKEEMPPQSNFVQSQNPYFMGNSFSEFDGHSQDG